MPEFRLDPEVSKYMDENGVDETEAANELGLNYDEIWDVVEGTEDDI
ncbi:hypothetical protein NST33_20815 [Paenibacillus sp. FSL L8-0435]